MVTTACSLINSLALCSRLQDFLSLADYMPIGPPFKRGTLLKTPSPYLELRTEGCALGQPLKYYIDIVELVPLSLERMIIRVLKSGTNRPAS